MDSYSVRSSLSFYYWPENSTFKYELLNMSRLIDVRESAGPLF
jgi:hypothetical protein